MSTPAQESINIRGTLVADPANPQDTAPLIGPLEVGTVVPPPQTPAGGLAAVAVSGLKINVLGMPERTALGTEKKARAQAVTIESETHVDQMPLDHAASLASDYNQDLDVEDELEDQQDAIVDALVVIDALESLAEVLPPESGSLDSQSTRLLAVATESLCAQVGMNVALELDDEDPFDAYWRRRLNPPPTPVDKAKRFIKEKAQQIWRAIIEALKKAWKWLKGHAMRFIDQSIRAEKRAAELIKTIGSSALHQRKKDTLDNDRLLQALAVGSKWPEHIDRAAISTSLVVQHQLEKAYTHGLYDAEVLKRLSSGHTEFQYDPEQVRHETFLSVEQHKTAEGVMWATQTLLGNYALVQELPAHTAHEFEALRWMLRTPQLRSVAGPVQASEIPVATPSQMLVCAKVAQQISRSTNDFRNTLEDLEKMAEKLIQAAEGALVDVQKTGNPTGMLELKLKYQRQYLAQAPRWLIHEPTQVANYAVRMVNALLSYVEKSLACYQAA